MLLVFLFGLVGISVAGENTVQYVKIWLPLLLIVMSAAIIITTVIRLTKRFRHQLSKDLEPDYFIRRNDAKR
jgi:integral membrane sensor domain MASE1